VQTVRVKDQPTNQPINHVNRQSEAVFIPRRL